MNIITTQRTNQTFLAGLETQVGKLADHVEEVDDHLRGVAGESLDTRTVILEREGKAHWNELRAHGNLLRQISSQVAEIKDELSGFKIQKGIAEGTEHVHEKNKGEKREWYKTFWLPIILAALGAAGWFGQYVVTNREEVRGWFERERLDPVKMRAQIEKDKRGPRGKAVKKKLKEIEREASGE